jgi:hypothetical protein
MRRPLRRRGCIEKAASGGHGAASGIVTEQRSR